ncbi:hypothetical protein NHX12_003467 [Muraenolepis orangiensis]|uniref:Uncharacterized protein n=1 Tax=Muraenolepis orangiensis TaxID=630683 RepID=A0A9Q0DYF8_9TELE|nr:hypothetical protein NHX12_003467 [Muraenolepis orangiensis]
MLGGLAPAALSVSGHVPGIAVPYPAHIFLANQNLYTVEQNDAEELVARAARNIEQLLGKRSAALEKLATAAESLQLEHRWKDDFEVTRTG